MASETESDPTIWNIYSELAGSFGGQGWWPTLSSDKRDRQTEIILGAFLTQNASWRNVEKAIGRLADEGLISFSKIKGVAEKRLARLIRPVGYYNQKAARLKAFAEYVCENYDCDVSRMLSKSTGDLRCELLQLNGICPETADAILLYAALKPVFIADAYSKRIFSRIGLFRDIGSLDCLDYDELQKLVSESLPVGLSKTEQLNQFHALIVELGKRFCLKNEPLCSHCPVLNLCGYGKITRFK